MPNPVAKADWIWKDGEFIPWAEAKVHIMSLAVQFGSSVFEGIRCYGTAQGPAIFRLREHLRRLQDSCRIYRITLPHATDDLVEACRAAVERNGFEECYLRPMVLRGLGRGMNPTGTAIEVYIPCFPWGTYLGEGALENGVDVRVSSWQRPEPNTFPAMAKAAGHYNNAQLMKMEAVVDGYAEAIALGTGGMLSEGSGENIFVIKNGTLYTPQADGSFLWGVTRDAVLTIASDLGIPIREQGIPREMLYAADELFFSGTAVEVTPIRSVDRITVGQGQRGPITQRIQERFFGIARGQMADSHNWLTLVKRSAAGSKRAPAAGAQAGAGAALPA